MVEAGPRARPAGGRPGVDRVPVVPLGEPPVGHQPVRRAARPWAHRVPGPGRAERGRPAHAHARGRAGEERRGRAGVVLRDRGLGVGAPGVRGDGAAGDEARLPLRAPPPRRRGAAPVRGEPRLPRLQQLSRWPERRRAAAAAARGRRPAALTRGRALRSAAGRGRTPHDRADQGGHP